MITIELENLYIGTVLTFCENVKALGCPEGESPTEWFQKLPYEKRREVAEKMIEIEEKMTEDVTPSPSTDDPEDH